MRSRWGLGLVAVAYAAGLAWLVVGADAWSLNRLTVRLYVTFRDVAPAGALPEHYGVLLNVLLFVPFGWLAVRGLRIPWWAGALAGVAVSAVIELGQHLFLDRQGELVDVLANGAGALIGAVLSGLRRRR